MSDWSELRRYMNKHAERLREGSNHILYRYKGRMIRVSRGSGEIGRDLWRDILKHQLGLTQEEFNAMK